MEKLIRGVVQTSHVGHHPPSLPFSSLPITPSPSPTSPPVPLEVGPLIAARGSGGVLKLPQQVRPAAKRYLVHFGLKKNASGTSNFKYIFTKILQQIRQVKDLKVVQDR